MAVNRFSKPVNNRVISQFVPQDMRLLASLVQQRQQRYDVATQRQEVIQDQLSTLSGVGASDMAILGEAGTAMDEISKEYAGKDLSDPRIAKEFMSRSKGIINNPLIRATQQTAASVAKHKEDMQKMVMEGTYKDYNDPFSDQLEAYEAQGGAKGGAIGYGGIIKGVDEDAEMSKLFNNMPKSGWKNYAMIGDKIKEVGWEGISQTRMFGDPNNPNSTGMVGSQFGAHWNSKAGEQQRRRFAQLERNGQIPEGMGVEEYVMGHLTSKAQEFVGGVTTGGGIGDLAAGSGGNLKNSAKFTLPMARKLADAGIDFNEETGALEGSGSTKFLDFFTGKTEMSLWEIATAKDLTDEEKEAAKPISIAAKMWGVTPEEAFGRMDVTITPSFSGFTSMTKKNLAQKEFETKGAGHYSAMTVYRQDGTLAGTGQEIFDELGITEDGVYDPDAAKGIGVNVLGQHNPKSGGISNGIHVAIGGETFIFAETRSSRQDKIDSWSANLMAGGVNQIDSEVLAKKFEYPIGTYFVFNKDRPKGSQAGIVNKDGEIEYQ